MKKMMLAIAVCLGFALTSCQKSNNSLDLLATASRTDDATTDRCKGKPIPNCGCPDVWAPVCGCDGVTYSNSCEATCAGVRHFTNGPCEEECMGKPQPYCPCPDVWAPVCGCNGVTYSNSCEATCAGVLSYTSGPCGGYGGIDPVDRKH